MQTEQQDLITPKNGPALKETNYGALSTLVTVFFFWGFIAAGNSVFIPFCKHYFHLDQFQSQLIDFAFYTAYYIGALVLFAYGAFGGKDLVGKWGYKKSIVYGLLFSALGAAAMIIAVNANTFAGMLVGLFIVALGFSLQQTAAQPFAISLGDPSTGTSRVNLGGGINSFGTTIGPIVVAIALFGSTAAITDEKIAALSLSKVIILYTCVGALFIGAAALFYFSKKVPAGISLERVESGTKALYTLLIMTGLLIIMFVPVFSSYKTDLSNATDAEKHALEAYRLNWLLGALAVVVIGLLAANMSAKKNAVGWGAMKYPQLVLGMLAIFVYVGVEVSIGSNLSETDPVNGDELHWTNAKPYVVYGNALVPNGKTLVVDAGARVHFHANSSLIVNQNASIQVNGGNPPANNPENITNEVIFEGDRLEPSFANVPGQWGSIIILSELNTNTINHLTIKNATVGLLAQKRLAVDEDDTHQPKVTITNSQIYNCSNVGILGRDAQITGSNLVVNYCGEASLAATLGGSYNFTHCTFNNNWNSSSQVAVLLSNYLETSTTLYISDLNAANFNNCIIYGSNQIEMFLDKKTEAPSLFNYKFNHCLIKFNNINNQFSNNPLYPPTNTTDYTSCYIATNSSTFNPKFKNVAKNKLWLSEAWNTAMTNDAVFSSFNDIVGNSRSSNVALGAYQFVP